MEKRFKFRYDRIDYRTFNPKKTLGEETLPSVTICINSRSQNFVFASDEEALKVYNFEGTVLTPDLELKAVVITFDKRKKTVYQLVESQ